MLKMAIFDCALNGNVAALTENGEFALFFCPHPGGFVIQDKKNANTNPYELPFNTLGKAARWQ